ncbi:hypothetical protein PINS_up001211 [Pythium insidiosum]|nr:hypothetical protein PINS_up001211 [Pythium insidiosum]
MQANGVKSGAPLNAAKALLPKRRLLHRHSDPQLCDADMLDAVDMSEHVAWASLDEPIYSEKDFEIYCPTPKQSALPVYYAKGWLPYSADTLLNTLMDASYRKGWDTITTEASVIERRKEGSDVVYCAVQLPWPFAMRDYVYNRRMQYFAKQHAFVVICQAMHHVDAPQANSVVRVETFSMRMSIRSTGAATCEFCLEYEDDTSFSIPSYVLSWLVSVKVPTYVTDLRRACAQYPSYLKTVGASNYTTPSQLLRRLAEEPTGTTHLPNDESVVKSPLSTLSRTDYSSSSNEAYAMEATDTASPRSVHNLSSTKHDRSDDEMSSSSRRSGRFFQRSTTAYIDEGERGEKAAKLKKASSMSRLFSGKKSKSRTTKSQGFEDEFSVTFVKQKIGLHLEADTSSNRIYVANYDSHDPNESDNAKRIEAGLVVTSINGRTLGDVSFEEAMAEIRQSGRPLQLGFRTTASSF